MNRLAVYILPALVLLNVSFSSGQDRDAKRLGYLHEIMRLQEHPARVDSFVSFHDKTWAEWQKRTGELPPDFDAMPSMPFLPDPLVLRQDGEQVRVTTPRQWDQQRAYISEQVQHWISGTFPSPPGGMSVEVQDEEVHDGVRVQLVELRFGSDQPVRLTIELFTPPGDGPFPVFMTQWNHRGWAQIAARRGYMGLVYAGADIKDDTRDYLALYPEHDWSTLMTRAWGAHRAVDYLYSLDNVDRSRIAITGHSRNGKQSILAAAFDERITAIISSSGGTGGEVPYRFTDGRHGNESIEFLYARRTHWAHPRIRFFAGREHKLPIDQTSLLALVAPRALLLSSSVREIDGDPWAIEQAFHTLKPVYEFLNAPGRLGIRLRDGQHAVEARDIEDYLDWLDVQFGRSDLVWENKLFYGYSFEEWKKLANESIDPGDFPNATGEKSGKRSWRRSVEDREQTKAAIRAQINWLTGVEPAGIPAAPISEQSGRDDYLTSFMNRPVVKHGKKINIAPYSAVGDYLHASLFYPTDTEGEMKTRPNGKLPAVIFLHGFTNTGFDATLTSLFDRILEKGMAVLAMDLIGYGTRIEEGTRFYLRYPRWSKLGKMVTDTRAAIDALSSLSFVDKEKIFVSGFALGGTVSLFTAALDDRVAGAAVSSAFTPLRDPDNTETEGVRAYSHLYGLLPRLGFFVEYPNLIPVDFDEILSVVAPRPLLVISPALDRHANQQEVQQTIDDVRAVYTLLRASDNLSFEAPPEFNGLSEQQEKFLAEWLGEMSMSTAR